MWPLTFGAIPTKFARMVASSVSGRYSHCQAAAAATTRAHTRMRAPTTRPATRRHPPCPSSGSSAGSATEHSQPEGEGDDDNQTRVHERPRPEIRVDPNAREELPEEDGADDTDHQREHPRREVGACHGDVGTRAAPGERGARDGHQGAGRPRVL